MLRRRLQRDVWNLALVRAPIQAFLLGRPTGDLLREVPAPPRGFYRADPFGVARPDGSSTVLFERYDLRARRGSIWSAEVGADGGWGEERLALPLPGHASYPFVVAVEGEVFCIPETLSQREVGLYRAVGFPSRWVKETSLLSDVRVADATVFPHQGRWWLACVNLDLDRGAGAERLFLYFADRLTGPYRPHLQNPVKVDRRGARPAGTPFVHQGHLYRPGQDCSRTYGGGVVLHRIEQLTPSAFQEVPVVLITGADLGAAGLHTLSALGGITLLDLNRPRFFPELAHLH